MRKQKEKKEKKKLFIRHDGSLKKLNLYMNTKH